MLAEEQGPIIAFVWRPGEISAPVSEMAQRTGSRAIFDFSSMGAEALHSFLQTAEPAGQVSDIRISTSALMNPSIGQLLKETGTRNLWVECQSQFLAGDTSAFQRRLRTLSEDYRCFPIVGDVPLLAAMVKDSSGIGRIVLKGCEAAGFVSGETTLVLYSAAKEMLHAYAKSLDVFIWGGVSSPEAAAAFLSTGAAGIVFESVHWLTDLVVMDDHQRQQLAKLRMDSTALVGLDLQVPCRLFNKGNSLAFKRIQAFEDSLCASEITDESRRAFVGQVQASALHPLDSHFT
ncbi:MAG: acyl transferase, partial [Desulfobaccales bacterium]